MHHHKPLIYCRWLCCTLLVVSWLHGNWAAAQTATPTVTATAKSAAPAAARLFKLQIAAYRELNFAKNVTQLDSIGTLYVEDDPNGIYRIVMGYYNDAATAKTALGAVRAAGYQTAYLATHAADAPRGIATSQLWAADEPELMFAKPTANATEQLMIDNNVAATETTMAAATEQNLTQPSNDPATKVSQYAIDLGSLEQIGDTPLGALNGLGELFTSQRNHLLAGGYANADEANAQLQKIRKNGFDKAVVVPNATTPNSTNNKTAKLGAAKTTPAATAKVAVTAAAPAQQAEAVFSPVKKASTANTKGAASAAPAAAPAAQASSTPPKPNTYKTTTTSPTAKKPAAQQAKLDVLFADVLFDMIKIDAYDPTQENIAASTTDTPEQIARNQQLKGTKIDPALWTLFDGKAKDGTWSQYALFKFELDNQHIGYLIRAGKNTYLNDNAIDLYVYNTAQQQFVVRQNLSQVSSTNNSMSVTEGWIMDLDNDGVQDVLLYTVQENTEPDKGYQAVKGFKGRVWRNAKFNDVKINNETLLKQNLGIVD